MGKKAKKENESPCKETFDPPPIESKDPATVVLLLSSPEEDVQMKACEAIYKFAEKGDENKVSLLGLGALDPLCQLISHSNKLLRRNALTALGTMANNADVHSVMKKVDIIPSIIEILLLEEDPDIVAYEFATMCLAALSVNILCRVQIYDNKGLPPLIQLLSSPDPDVNKFSLETIFNLVQDYPCRMVLHELGAIPPILDLVRSDFPVIQLLALKTLVNITTDKHTCATFREEQGFEKIMDILNDKELNDLHHEALQIVSNCLRDSECLNMIQKGGGLTRLMEFILSPTLPETLSDAVNCIARAAERSEVRTLLHVQELEKALVELLTLEDSSVKAATCHAVASMSLSQASKDTFRDMDSIPVVVELLQSECLMLRGAATKALSNLTHSSQLNACTLGFTVNIPSMSAVPFSVVHQAGGHEVLVQMLGDRCAETVAHAAATLGNMAGQETLRCSILAQGAMQALMEPLKSTNTQILISTVQCLVVMAGDVDARAELRRAGGLQLLVKLLHSTQREVFHNACLAVSVCARDEPSAVQMCKFGALERLLEINQSVNRCSSLSMLATSSLLNSNLSVKYSLTGQLAPTDIIRDGFYDAGQVRAGERVLTLVEFCKQPVNARRPIIAVILSTDKSKKKETDKVKEGPEKEKAWRMTDDASLQLLVKEATESILQLDDEREQYTALARLVSRAMGGVVQVEKLHEFPWELHLSEIKFKLQSNVVPIGMISAGIYYHRALLFKCLSDRMGLSCTLVRGDYSRAWNEVTLFRQDCPSHICRFVVDLMHQPGNLLKANTPAAVRYQTI
ncbi:armadillo repeat-containing protein 3 [Genypterus blacodes]|uniref:armadillo repeat-containing protein 3 n=1 Tax=Genypterus blacodes TaxID=154954 RepID=UPI003F76AEB3